MFQTNIVEKKTTYFMFNNFLPPENGAVYEIGAARQATGDNTGVLISP